MPPRKFTAFSKINPGWKSKQIVWLGCIVLKKDNGLTVEEAILRLILIWHWSTLTNFDASSMPKTELPSVPHYVFEQDNYRVKSWVRMWSRPVGTCICSTCWDQSFFRTCCYFYELCSSNIPRYLLDFTSRPPNIKWTVPYARWNWKVQHT